MQIPTRQTPRLALAVAALAACALAVCALPAGAQYTTAPAPAAYALRGVTVVGADGARTIGVTVVVRNGLIEAMAPGAAVPAGAKVLEGDSLVVYPGLVDAHGAARFAFPEPEIDRAQLRSWDAPRAAQGFLPHRRVADVLQATGKDLADQRKSGVVAAAVFPEPALMPGQGTVITLRPSASTPAQLVVTPSVGTLLSLRGGRGVYPGSVFATTAFLRQTFEDARHARLVRAAWERDPRGMTTPAADPDYRVVQSIMSGDQRAFFVANSVEEIGHALALGEQYGFTPVIVGGADAHHLADRLKARNVPVLVSLDFGTPRRWKPDDAGKADSARKAADTTDAAVLRERRDFEERYANAGKLARAGVRIALTSGGGKAKLLDGARTAIRYGLDTTAALRALTATPAELLGVPRANTLAVGAPASFVVTDGPLFGKETRVRYTFVEGELEEGRTGPTPRRSGGTTAGSAAGARAVAGGWDVELTSAQGTLTGAMTITGDASAFTGTIDTEMGQLLVRDGKVEGDTISFTLVLPFAGNMELPVTAPLRDDGFTATAPTPMGQATIAARKKDPGATMHDHDAASGRETH
ncbi:MAG TPA: amidohydrolase family protein [Gemmatimonadales bacterium]